MFNMKKKIILVGAMALVITLTNCGGGDKDTADHSMDSATTAPSETVTPAEPVTVDETAMLKFDMLLANMPSPMEILNDLNSSKTPYNHAFMVQDKKYSNATTPDQKAICMGMYSIDMSYVINYDQSQEALGYMVSVKKISDELGISQYYNKSFYDRFSKNLGNKDSLMNMVNSAYSLTDNYCRSNDQLKTATYIFTGSWIESLHMAVDAIGGTDQNESNKALYTRIWNQRFHLKQLIDATIKFKNEPEFKKMRSTLDEILALCTKPKQASDLTKENVAEIGKKVYELRKSIAGE